MSTDSGRVSDGIYEYQAKNNSGWDNITAKPYRFYCYHQLMIGSYTRFAYLVMLGKPKSIPFSCYPLEKKISICPSLTLESVHH